MRCPDCNGTGRYVGFTRTENCSLCNGSGEFVVPNHLPTDDELCASPPRPMIPMVGERVYYYIDDIEGEITLVDEEERYFEAEFVNGSGYGDFKDLVWNVTHDRWEVVRTRV